MLSHDCTKLTIMKEVMKQKCSTISCTRDLSMSVLVLCPG